MRFTVDTRCPVTIKHSRAHFFFFIFILCVRPDLSVGIYTGREVGTSRVLFSRPSSLPPPRAFTRPSCFFHSFSFSSRAHSFRLRDTVAAVAAAAASVSRIGCSPKRVRVPLVPYGRVGSVNGSPRGLCGPRRTF